MKTLQFFGLLSFELLISACAPIYFDSEPMDETQVVNPRSVTLDVVVNRKVDVLFVIDSSRSMGDEQGKLAANFSTMLAAVDQGESPADYRVAVVSTSVDSPLCLPGSFHGSQNGIMHYSSCLDRSEDFHMPESNTYRFNTACASRCDLHSAALATTPTTTTQDSTLRSRPWIQREDGVLNLPAGVDAAGAFQCIAPQGVVGCGMEAPLEAMARALKQANDPASPNFGFLREDAALTVVFVTDETDCSTIANDPEAPLGQVGADNPFWKKGSEVHSDAALACVLAGTNCTGGDANGYANCEVANWNADRSLLLDDEVGETSAVLRPVAHYIHLLDSLRYDAAGQKVKEVSVTLIGGVDPLSGEPIYKPAEMIDGQPVGLAAGCTTSAQILEEQDALGTIIPAQSVTASAAPPVRLLKLVDAFADNDADRRSSSLFSVCAENFGDPLQQIGERILDHFAPTCYDACVFDNDPLSGELNPSCDVMEYRGEQAPRALLECLRGPGGRYLRNEHSYVVPEGEERCYVYRIDPANHTEDLYDQLDPRCVTQGVNLGFSIQQRPDVAIPQGTRVVAECLSVGGAGEPCEPPSF